MHYELLWLCMVCTSRSAALTNEHHLPNQGSFAITSYFIIIQLSTSLLMRMYYKNNHYKY